MTNATERRCAAVRATVESFLVDGYGDLKPDVTAALINVGLQQLAGLGRTVRWRHVMAGWMELIRLADGDRATMRDMLLRGSVAAIHAA